MRAATAGLLGLVAILGLVAGCDSDESVEPDEAFYLEAEILVTDADSGGSPRTVDRRTATGLRWWYRDDAHYRHEFYNPRAMLEWGPRWTVADGEDVTYYDPTIGLFERSSLGEFGFAGLYPTMSAFVGPLPADNLDDFIAQWGERVDHIGRAGTAEVLGREVEVIEYGPTSNSSGGTGDATSSGLGQFYVDVDAGFILRHTVDGGAGGVSFEAEVTHLELAPHFEEDPFEVDLPPGALEITDPSGSCSASSGGTSPGAGSFSVGRTTFDNVPAGWTLAGSGAAQGAGCVTLEEWASLVREPGKVLIASVIAAPPTGVPPARADATRVDVAGVDGYRLTEGEIERLLWVRDEVIITLSSNAATFDELLRIAVSAR